MRDGKLSPMGGPGGIVEADETYIGRQQGLNVDKSSYHNKNMVVTLVERGGSARSFHTDGHSLADIVPIVRDNIRRESRLMTDRALHYKAVGQEFAEHGRVEHEKGEYVSIDDPTIHTEKHLHRYLAEFDFRYSNRVALGVVKNI